MGVLGTIMMCTLVAGNYDKCVPALSLPQTFFESDAVLDKNGDVLKPAMSAAQNCALALDSARFKQKLVATPDHALKFDCTPSR